MQLPLQSFSTLLQQMAAAVQGSANQLIDLTVGSVLRALLEASASAALWLQWLILQVLTVTRAATSNEADLDSWMADYSLYRLPGAAALGTVTFARYTAGLATTVPVGALVRTSDGLQSFAVVAVPGNPAWNGQGGYTLAAMAASVDVPVQALAVGAAGNIQPGSIGYLATAIAGIDTVGNASAFAGGMDAEPDSALRHRFQLYINSRSLATKTAIEFALASVQLGLRYLVQENQDQSGNLLPGHFCVTVDDGTGMPRADLLSSAQAAVDAVRPIGATYQVTGPQVVPVSISFVLVTNNPQTRAGVAASVQAALLQWIGGLPIGGTLALSRVDAIAHGVDASVMSVGNVLLNGAAVDLAAPANGVLLAQSVSIS